MAAGARGDMGQSDAAVAMLQVPDLQDDDAPWAARLRYAYADSLLAAGRTDEAREWFARSADTDEDLDTDAAERLLELDGVVIDDPSEPANQESQESREGQENRESKESQESPDGDADVRPIEGATGARPRPAVIFTEPPAPEDGR